MFPSNEKPLPGLPGWVLATTDGFPGVVTYGMSKCVNVLFTVALKERPSTQGIESFAVDPGSELNPGRPEWEA